MGTLENCPLLVCEAGSVCSHMSSFFSMSAESSVESHSPARSILSDFDETTTPATKSASVNNHVFGGVPQPLYKQIVEKILSEAESTKWEKALKENYCVKDGFLLENMDDGRIRYVVMREDTEYILSQIHILLGHGARERMKDLFRSSFSFGTSGTRVRKGCLDTDVKVVRQSCRECRLLANKTFLLITTTPGAGLSLNVTPVVDASPGEPRFTLSIDGIDSAMVNDHLKGISALADKSQDENSILETGPMPPFEEGQLPSINREQYDELRDYLKTKKLPQRFMDVESAEKRQFIKNAKVVSLDPKDGTQLRILNWEIPRSPLVVCEEEVEEITTEVHQMLAHISSEQMADILSRTMYWKDIKLSMEAAAARCEVCKQMGGTVNSKYHPINCKTAEIGFSIAFDVKGTGKATDRAFSLEYGTVDRDAVQEYNDELRVAIKKESGTANPAPDAMQANEKVAHEDDNEGNGQFVPPDPNKPKIRLRRSVAPRKSVGSSAAKVNKAVLSSSEGLQAETLDLELPEKAVNNTGGIRKANPNNGILSTPRRVVKRSVTWSPNLELPIKKEAVDGSISLKQNKENEEIPVQCVPISGGYIFCPPGFVQKKNDVVTIKRSVKEECLSLTIHVEMARIGSQEASDVAVKPITKPVLPGNVEKTMVGEFVIPNGFDLKEYDSSETYVGDNLAFEVVLRLKRVVESNE